MTCITLPGYNHLYHSLLRFTQMSRTEALRLVYVLNTANIDTYTFCFPVNRVTESCADAFYCYMKRKKRPYRTEVQLYKALCCLCQNIDEECITADQQEAVERIHCLMRDLNYRFRAAYGMEIDDWRTVYAECAYSLVPLDNEPGVCLYEDHMRITVA